jgi:hypothetical protein
MDTFSRNDEARALIQEAGRSAFTVKSLFLP